MSMLQHRLSLGTTFRNYPNVKACTGKAVHEIGVDVIGTVASNKAEELGRGLKAGALGLGSGLEEVFVFDSKSVGVTARVRVREHRRFKAGTLGLGSEEVRVRVRVRVRLGHGLKASA